MVICLERDADLHMAQLMPLLLAVSRCLRLVLPFWYWLTRVVPEKGPLNVCVCAAIHISQGIVETYFRCGGIFKYDLLQNYHPESVSK